MSTKDYQKGSSLLTAIIIGGIAIIIAAGVFGYFYFYRIPEPSVVMEIEKPDEVLAGEPFSVTVLYRNESDTVLKEARMIISLPDGISFLGIDEDKRVREELVGDISPGSIGRRTINLVAEGEGQELKRLEARLRYGIPASDRAKFESNTAVDIAIGPPAISLSFFVPDQVFGGETFTSELEYRNNTEQEFTDLELSLELPPSFKITHASPGPEDGEESLWKIPSLLPGERNRISFTGSVLGEEGSFFGILATLKGRVADNVRILNSKEANIGISRSPLSVSVVANGSEDYIASIGDIIRYQLSYRNNSDIPLRNIILKATLSGELFEFGTLETDASFNPSTRTLTWNVATLPELRQLLPGESRSVDFSIQLAKSFPARRLSDKNFVLQIETIAESPTVPPGVEADKTITVTTRETRIKGLVELEAFALFNETVNDIKNTGVYPPIVGTPTQYTIHWKISNHATDIKEVRVSAFLRSGAIFTGKVYSNSETQPQYDPETGEVFWDIPAVPANKGILDEPYEAVFQIEATPSLTSVNRHLRLLGESTLIAKDDFVDLILKDTSREINTSLPFDTGITTEDRSVKP